jgi:hypothetical protein
MKRALIAGMSLVSANLNAGEDVKPVWELGKALVDGPVVFFEGMVLQQGMPVPAWGWARPGDKVTVVFRSDAW